MSAGLRGTGLVADDLYLIAHSDLTGKPLLSHAALASGSPWGGSRELNSGYLP
jgi:hypothetical protein